MTFSIAGTCSDTGEIGYAVATSSVCVGARVGMAGPGLCVVFSQARTDPRLHQVGFDAFRRTHDAKAALNAMRDAAIQPEWRQLGVFAMDGSSSHHTGSGCLDHAGGIQGRGCLALGNAIASAAVLEAMVSGFENTRGPLAARLIAGLKGGEQAGGEINPLQSACLRVYGEYDFPVADIRIDKHEDSIGELSALWDDWSVKADDYILRALDPGSAKPSDEIERLSAG